MLNGLFEEDDGRSASKRSHYSNHHQEFVVNNRNKSFLNHQPFRTNVPNEYHINGGGKSFPWEESARINDGFEGAKRENNTIRTDWTAKYLNN